MDTYKVNVNTLISSYIINVLSAVSRRIPLANSHWPIPPGEFPHIFISSPPKKNFSVFFKQIIFIIFSKLFEVVFISKVAYYVFQDFQ